MSAFRIASRYGDGGSTRSGEEKGAAMIEYALLVVGIAVVVGAAAAVFGGDVSDMFGGLIP